MSDFLCSVYGIPLTPNHLPERPEGIFCTVIKPADSSSWSSQEDTQPRGMRRPIQDNGPFASRDYRYYNGGASNQGTVHVEVVLLQVMAQVISTDICVLPMEIEIRLKFF